PSPPRAPQPSIPPMQDTPAHLLSQSRAAHPGAPHSSPTRRSSDLLTIALDALGPTYLARAAEIGMDPSLLHRVAVIGSGTLDSLDRKSTRLNSSHVKTSYAVFCSKKKTLADVAKTDSATPAETKLH